MPERMKEISRMKVKGDIIMNVIKDDVVVFCGSEELWPMVYVAHMSVDCTGNETYIGVSLRLVKCDDGKLFILLSTGFLAVYTPCQVS